MQVRQRPIGFAHHGIPRREPGPEKIEAAESPTRTRRARAHRRGRSGGLRGRGARREPAWVLELAVRGQGFRPGRSWAAEPPTRVSRPVLSHRREISHRDGGWGTARSSETPPALPPRRASADPVTRRRRGGSSSAASDAGSGQQAAPHGSVGKTEPQETLITTTQSFSSRFLSMR